MDTLAATAVQMLGFDILDWAAEGKLANLNTVATEEGWDAVVPAASANSGRSMPDALMITSCVAARRRSGSRS